VARARRIRRKDLKQPDQFVAASQRVVEWLRNHAAVAAAVGGVAVVVLLAVVVTGAFRNARRRDANADLGRAMASLHADNLADAATELADVARRWDGTRVAELASVLAAHTELRLGKADSAIAEIEDALRNPSDLPSYFRQQLLVAWGDALLAKGDWTGATEKFEQAANMDGPYTAQAILSEARAQEQGGDSRRAQDLYRKFYEQFPEDPSRDLVESKMSAGPVAEG
jgi:outer membrane protein assembly factor BamD (BamD/ComL family)